MKTYEDFLAFLEEHLKPINTFIPVSDNDFHPICIAVARFMLSEPYRWESLLDKWPKVPEILKPTEEELTDFFKTRTGLPLSFKKELSNNDYPALYKAYNILFPIIVLKDDFYSSIFRTDILRRRWKTIIKGSDAKIKRIIEKINTFKNEKTFIQLMTKFTGDLSGFSLTLINNKKLLDQVVTKLSGIN